MSAIQEVFQIIDAALKEDPSRAQGTVAVYQFNITGEGGGSYQVVLRENEGHAVEGAPETPDCTLTIDAEDFKQMVDGQLNGTEAFMSGKLQIDGDMSLALRLNDIIEAYREAQGASS